MKSNSTEIADCEAFDGFSGFAYPHGDVFGCVLRGRCRDSRGVGESSEAGGKHSYDRYICQY